jgi:hypothetical protein
MNRVSAIFLIALLTLSVGLTPTTLALAKSPGCPKLDIDPAKVDFKNVPLDEPGARSVLVTNTSGNESADILTISAEPNPPFEVEQAITNCKGELAPKKNCGVTIVCSPTAEKKFKGHATIAINGCKAVEIKLTCNGSKPVGATATATATPTKTATATPTATSTLTATATATATRTSTSTPTSTATATISATATVSATATSTSSATSTPTATATPGPALFVTISGSSVGAGGTVAAYLLPLSSDPNTPPSGTFTGSSLSGPVGIGLDAGGNIYVANGSSSTITTYPPGSNGNVTPSRSIGGATTTLLFPSLLTLNSTPNIYVANTGGGSCDGNVTVFPASGNGNIAPSAEIACTSVPENNTQLVHPDAVALDSKGNIYVTNQNSPSITIYSAGSTGNVAPMTTIVGGNHACMSAGNPFSCCTDSGSGTCVDSTQLGSPFGIAIDANDNFYVTNEGGPPGAPGSSVTIYSALAEGDVGFINRAPLATIAGSNTMLAIPMGIVVDPVGTIYVANLEAGETANVTVYAPLLATFGMLNEAPIATINTAPSVPGNPIGLAIGQFTPPK